jgi:KaiC/GvpD/RAD55 family RecA-like ATPase
MEQSTTPAQIEKLATGVLGFDLIADGGLPQGRTTLVSGTAGSAKTVLAAQFLVEGVRIAREAGVFVTFEESPADIRRNLRSLGWDIAAWENEGLWLFVDASPQLGEELQMSGGYDLGALLARLEHAVRKIDARRVSLDSLSAIFARFQNSAIIRYELLRLAMALKRLAVTTIMTAERTEEYGDIARFGVEEFVADNVVILRNSLEDEKRRRTVEILKFRSANHQKGEFPFTITPQQGVTTLPLSALELQQKSSNLRIPSGIPELDAFSPARVAIDSLSALERVATAKGFREFVIGLTFFIKQREVAGLLTSTAPTLMGGTSVTEAHISTLTDSIILLRYVEMYGEVRRGLTVLKMRGSRHDKDIREFTIDGARMHIGKPFRTVTGILAGSPMYATASELERLGGLFQEDTQRES